MCRWLYHFVTEAYKKHFARIGFNYLALKRLDLDSWAECIKDGRKGDFLVLYELSPLVECHSVVHLKGGKIWTTLDKQSTDHAEILEQCGFYFAYVGRELFVQLVKCRHPIIVVEQTEDIKTIELGTLTFDENKTL